MSNKFQVIVSDPPWSFKDSLKMSDVPRGSDANYATMSNADIIGLDVKSVADSNGCVLALWVPSTLLQLGLDVMKAWGFEHKQTYIWVKTKKNPLEDFKKHLVKFFRLTKKMDLSTKDYIDGLDPVFDVTSMSRTHVLEDVLAFFMGRLFRQTHEICLIGINNKKIYKKLANKSQRSVSFGENLKHSAKPDNLQNSLEMMFPDTNKLEMFARRELNGWTCVGNEVCNGEDIRDSLKRLI